MDKEKLFLLRVKVKGEISPCYMTDSGYPVVVKEEDLLGYVEDLKKVVELGEARRFA